MRNWIAHDYFGVDRDLIWQTVTDEFPNLRLLLHRALADLDSEPGPIGEGDD